jgi:hypothetical protein
MARRELPQLRMCQDKGPGFGPDPEVAGHSCRRPSIEPAPPAVEPDYGNQSEENPQNIAVGEEFSAKVIFGNSSSDDDEVQ